MPAPWWKTDYFEVRGENLRNTKKYYYECVGQGQRYEAFEFVRFFISQNPSERIPLHTREEVRAVTELVERFHSGDAGHARPRPLRIRRADDAVASIR